MLLDIVILTILLSFSLAMYNYMAITPDTPININLNIPNLMFFILGGVGTVFAIYLISEGYTIPAFVVTIISIGILAVTWLQSTNMNIFGQIMKLFGLI